MVKDTDAGDGVSVKTPGGRQRETTFPKNMASQIRNDRKKTKGKETIGYAERVSERIVVCGTKEKGRKQERVENMEAKNLPHGRNLTTNLCLKD